MSSTSRVNDAAILDATLAAVQRLGVRKLGLVDVAAEAGVSRHTIYRRFGGKDELLAAMGNHLVQRFYDDLLAAVEADPSPDDRVVVVVGTVLRLTREFRLGRLIETEPTFYRRFVTRNFGEWSNVVSTMLVWPQPLPRDRQRKKELAIAADAVLRHAISLHFLEPSDWQREQSSLTTMMDALLNSGAASPPARPSRLPPTRPRRRGEQ